jgi:putative MATE family efflux protein
MLVSALLHNAQSLIDLFWIGRLGSISVAAVSLSGTILMMMFPLVMGMAAGTVALIARRVGEGDYERASDTAGQALGLALVLGLIAGGTGYLFADDLCRLLGAEGELARQAGSYLRVSFLGSFSVFVLFVGGHSIFHAAGNATIPMFTMVLANVLNLILDPILIFGLLGFPRLEVGGAALATVVSQGVAALVAVGLLAGGAARIRIHLRQLLPMPHIVADILRIGLPSTGQMVARSLMALVLMRLVAGSGAVAVAAYGIGLRFHMIILMPAFALADAAATLVGQNLGAKNPARANKSAWLAAATGVGIMAFASTGLISFAPSLMGVFDGNPEVVAVGASFLRITSGFFVFAVLAITLERALMGAGDTVSPMVWTVVSLWGLQVPLALWWSRTVQPATDGIWWAMAVAVTVHGLLVTAWFMTGRWKRVKV